MIFRETVSPIPSPTLRVEKNGSCARCADFEREAFARIPHLDLQNRRAARLALDDVHRDIRIFRIGLQRIEHDLGKGMAQRLVIAGDFPRRDVLA